MEYRDKITSLARATPLLPSTVAKELSTNSIMAGAMLSEMCEKGILKTTALRVGGSPLYILPGNEAQLLNFLNSLNEKDRKTVATLEQEKVLREIECDPLTRVSLKHLKDFAHPLLVEYEGKQETFWKWFSLKDPEAEELIRKKLEPQNIVKEKITEKPEQDVNTGNKPQETQQALTQQNTPATASQSETKPQSKDTDAPPSGEFWEQVNKFLSANKINITNTTAIKKRTDYDLTIELPSPVGQLSYYCKARSKKKISEADLSAAYVQGQMHKLPVIFLTDGELTKQAQALLSQLKGITVKKV